MFLSKRWILIIISVTGIAFMILLVIQFGWTQKSIELNRRHFDDRMRIVSNKIREAFFKDKNLQKNWLSGSVELQELFQGTTNTENLEAIVRQKLDSTLKAEQMPLTSKVAGRTGYTCYLMNFVPAELHNTEIDHSLYKICLCNNNYPVRLDVGFDLLSNKLLSADSSGLVLPSVILILLLIALFAYIIYVINRQKILSELKNDFINNLTHEFNTPLFSIGLTSNLLLRSDAVNNSGKLKSYVELITTEKNRVQTQVDKILKLTAIESASLILQKEPVDMHDLIGQNIARFTAAITEKGGTISFRPGTTKYLVLGDPVHLFNAFSNLLDNAYKYSDKSPEIVITTRNSGNEFIVSIADNGIGLAKTEVNMIFSKFYRVKQGDRHDVKGFGLGLSYVKKIVDLHNGSIEVKSRPGEGSEFIIHLPCQN
ncbi:MAG: HAMP domain-containing sensor histidine kinase [Bacteroidota bacterium]